MIGGGKDAFIGKIHRMAAMLDGEIELVCGAFSGNPEKSVASGKMLYIGAERVYRDYQEMLQQESAMPEDVKMDFVSIVTPTHLHYEPAKMALEYGFHVVCDKPLTTDLVKARELKALAEKNNLIFAVTYNYQGYPVIKQARYMIKTGQLGKIRKVMAVYPQGWLAQPLENEGQKQASWRMNPAIAGISGTMADIGVHAQNLLEYVSGTIISEVCADLNTFVEGRVLDDDGMVMMRMENGAKGMLCASQVSAGEENPLKIQVYGEKGGLEWEHRQPDSLYVRWLDQPAQIFRAGNDQDYLCEEAIHAARMPAGHPEGFIGAFANIYKNFAYALKAHRTQKEMAFYYQDFPAIDEGLQSILFLETVVQSDKSDQKWMPLQKM